ncbi:MAG: hypothetical protein GXO33_07615 [Epsilonproteobacteria bacterium]|nr:hypothetical protein [Campylobacterota bacterium]
MGEEQKEKALPQPAEAVEKLLQEVQANGFMNMIDLDPYFGTVEIPLEREMEALEQSHPEAFAFFKSVMDELREEMEIHFETTEMYEDEEFDQFVEDCRIIKARFTDEFAKEAVERLKSLSQTISQA